MENNKNFKTSLGFILAAAGSAIGVGNIWGFPYKMGANGGFFFLLCYIIIVAIGGFIVMQGEIVIGRRSGRGIIESYKAISKKYAFIGYFGAGAVLLITGFCVTLTGYFLKYFLVNIGNLFHTSWGLNGATPEDYWANLLATGGWQIAILTGICALITMFILFKGTAGIETFCKYAMTTLLVIMIIVIIRSVTLPGAGAGLAFVFKPDFSVFEGSGWVTVLSKAGGQAFFSLSLGMAIMITYGSYMKKSEDVEKSIFWVVVMDTAVAILAGIAVFPAVFAFGHEPTGGTALLFVTLQTVFNSMGALGPVFGSLFYFLVVIAELTSLVSLFEPSIAFLTDAFETRQKKISRKKAVVAVTIFNAVMGILVAFDNLGCGGLPQPLGFCWMDFFDLFSEGILMPVGAFCMTILIGWVLGPKFMEDEITLNGNKWRTKSFTMFCMKIVTPIVLLFIFAGQIDSFFGLGWF